MSTTPAKQDFTIYLGGTWSKSFTVNEDWTGRTVYMQARYANDDASPITGWDLSSSSGGIVLTPGASSSTFVITVAYADVLNLTRTAEFDIMTDDGSGVRDYYIQGKLIPDRRTTQVA